MMCHLITYDDCPSNDGWIREIPEVPLGANKHTGKAKGHC